MTTTESSAPSSNVSSSKRLYAYCPHCGSSRIAKDAWAIFNPERQDWELDAIYDHTFCLDCETETAIEWRDTPLPRSERIARLNDILRQGKGSNGRFLITQGVQAKGDDFVRKAIQAVGAFSDFSGDNDPHSERDFGALDLDEVRLFFKIDYYDLDLEFGSDDPADPEKTKRVLTLMLAEEY